MHIEDLLRLQPGRVVQLDTMSGEPVDVLVNNRVVAKGEVIILNEAFCVRISEIYNTINKLDRQNWVSGHGVPSHIILEFPAFG